jgi:hypothetical protein
LNVCAFNAGILPAFRRRIYEIRFDRRKREISFSCREGARKQGASLSVVAIKEETDKRIEAVAEKIIWVGIGTARQDDFVFQK